MRQFILLQTVNGEAVVVQAVIIALFVIVSLWLIFG